MYTFALDAEGAALVGVKSGATCTDVDYQRLIDAHRRFWAEVGDSNVPKLVLVIDPGQKPPSASCRQRIAAAVRERNRPFRSAIVTPSMVERGIITALNWLRPPGHGQKVMSTETFDQAVVWLESETGPCSGLLRTLYTRARNDAKSANMNVGG